MHGASHRSIATASRPPGPLTGAEAAPFYSPNTSHCTDWTESYRKQLRPGAWKRCRLEKNRSALRRKSIFLWPKIAIEFGVRRGPTKTLADGLCPKSRNAYAGRSEVSVQTDTQRKRHTRVSLAAKEREIDIRPPRILIFPSGVSVKPSLPPQYAHYHL